MSQRSFVLIPYQHFTPPQAFLTFVVVFLYNQVPSSLQFSVNTLNEFNFHDSH